MDPSKSSFAVKYEVERHSRRQLAWREVEVMVKIQILHTLVDLGQSLVERANFGVNKLRLYSFSDIRKPCRRRWFVRLGYKFQRESAFHLLFWFSVFRNSLLGGVRCSNVFVPFPRTNYGVLQDALLCSAPLYGWS